MQTISLDTWSCDICYATHKVPNEVPLYLNQNEILREEIVCKLGDLVYQRTACSNGVCNMKLLVGYYGCKACGKPLRQINPDFTLQIGLVAQKAIRYMLHCSEECRTKSMREFKKDEFSTTSCGKCGLIKKDMDKCGRCRTTHYCSQKCQRDDWKEHKKSCKPIS